MSLRGATSGQGLDTSQSTIVFYVSTMTRLHLHMPLFVFLLTSGVDYTIVQPYGRSPATRFSASEIISRCIIMYINNIQFIFVHNLLLLIEGYDLESFQIVNRLRVAN